ncbi:protein-tyrosine phosphatase-like protein [Boeremia exigua]|uniref:protein-tyrosine phosphatase-like protein n=1 Tax=Boeremia exigua TaxID=749465 RepID=UPI001E8ED7AC|nr:protein-tyrosine phosphatase-like protein [Boeremia exigua]KAH6644209.1 protein-tyrosine phosphatase-like protein [Boeremia exigua]
MAAHDNSPLPSPPFFLIPNINNLRDAAISLSTPHGSIRQGILFRSAEVSKLDRSGWDAVHAVGVAHVFDLRSKPEVEKGWAGIVAKVDGTEDVRPSWLVDMESAGVQRTWVPVFTETDYSPEKLAERYQKYMQDSVEGFVAAYRGILASGGPAYKQIFTYLANLPPASAQQNAEAPGAHKLGALVHCTAGKDRTGVFFGLLFDFLGVPRAHIAAEYQLTEPGLAPVRDAVVERLLQSPGFQKYMQSTQDFSPEVREKGRQAALRMVGARKESILATLEMVDREFGGSERYMREVCGLGDAELEGLRRVLVVEQ